jgi:hypothetical protein
MDKVSAYNKRRIQEEGRWHESMNQAMPDSAAMAPGYGK